MKKKIRGKKKYEIGSHLSHYLRGEGGGGEKGKEEKQGVVLCCMSFSQTIFASCEKG